MTRLYQRCKSSNGLALMKLGLRGGTAYSIDRQTRHMYGSIQETIQRRHNISAHHICPLINLCLIDAFELFFGL